MKKTRILSLFVLVMLFSIKGNAQVIPMGFAFFQDELRRCQLKGQVDSNVSYLIQPVHPNRAFGVKSTWNKDEVLTPYDTAKRTKYTKWANKWLHAELLPFEMKFRYNHHHPYGWNDGAMIPSKGRQLYVSSGLFISGKYKFLGIEAQWKPELVQAQNLEFLNPPFRSRSIDFPERMGQDPYRQSFRGQSYVHVHAGPISIGYGTENVTWGAGRNNNIILSNNAPGFGHFTLHTNKPIKISALGTFEGQMLGGKLRPSGFKYPLRYTAGEWPPIAGDVVVDSLAPEFYSYFTGTKGVYQPKWLPGLFLGASRIVQIGGEPTSYRSYFENLYLGAKGEQTGGGPDSGYINRNQLVSISFRYLMPKAKFELYGEVGREDWAWDFEDFMTRPANTTAWMLGFRKLQAIPNQKAILEFSAEVTKIQAPMHNYGNGSSFTSGVYSFYMAGGGGSKSKGWTNRGQVLGAGIGPGSNMTTVGIKKIEGFNTIGLSIERVAYNQDLFYSSLDYLQLSPNNPLLKDFSKHFVDWGFIFNYQRKYGHLLLGYNVHLLRTYNFNWYYDPDGKPGDFRFPGINVWSLNLNLSAVYLF